MTPATARRLFQYRPTEGTLIWRALPRDNASMPPPEIGEVAGFKSDLARYVQYRGVDYNYLHIIKLIRFGTSQGKLVQSGPNDWRWSNLTFIPATKKVRQDQQVYANLPHIHTEPLLAGKVAEVFDYDVKSGVLGWKVNPAPRIKAGDPVKTSRVTYKGHTYSTNKLRWLFVHGVYPEHPVYRNGGILGTTQNPGNAQTDRARQDRAAERLRARQELHKK